MVSQSQTRLSNFHFHFQLPRSGNAEHMIVQFLIFWGTSLLFSILVAPIYIPTSSAQGLPVLHILANSYCLMSFLYYPLWQVWDSISLWFWFAFSWWLVMLRIFSCTCWLSVCFSQKSIYSGPPPLFRSLVSLLLSCMGYVHVLNVNPLSAHDL